MKHAHRDSTGTGLLFYRWFQNRDWLPTDVVFSCKLRNCRGACPGVEMRSSRRQRRRNDSRMSWHELLKNLSFDCPGDNRTGFLEAPDCDFGPKAQPFCQPGLKRSGGPGKCTQSIIEGQRPDRSHGQRFPYDHCMRSFMNGIHSRTASG
jgi:hypothetical protein